MQSSEWCISLQLKCISLSVIMHMSCSATEKVKVEFSFHQVRTIQECNQRIQLLCTVLPDSSALVFLPALIVTMRSGQTQSAACVTGECSDLWYRPKESSLDRKLCFCFFERKGPSAFLWTVCCVKIFPLCPTVSLVCCLNSLWKLLHVPLVQLL